VVSRHIRENANDPASVEFARWYPRLESSGSSFGDRAGSRTGAARHLGFEGLGRSAASAAYNIRLLNGGKPWVLVHVKFRARNAAGVPVMNDRLFYVAEGKVILDEVSERDGQPLDPRDKP
jgi:hypothetical protein